MQALSKTDTFVEWKESHIHSVLTVFAQTANQPFTKRFSIQSLPAGTTWLLREFRLAAAHSYTNRKRCCRPCCEQAVLSFSSALPPSYQMQLTFMGIKIFGNERRQLWQELRHAQLTQGG